MNTIIKMETPNTHHNSQNDKPKQTTNKLPSNNQTKNKYGRYCY